LLWRRSEILTSDQEMPHGGIHKSGAVTEAARLNLLSR